MILLSKNINLEKEAQAFVNKEKDVEDIDTAIAGAKDIIAEIMSDDAQIRKMIREEALKRGLLISKAKGEEDSVYRIYYDYSEPVRDVLPHRILARFSKPLSLATVALVLFFCLYGAYISSAS